jgi:formiminotetrahydrofolate cyclodeaminase
MGEGSLLSLTVGELLDAVAARTPAPGGGASAAVVTGLAAALTAMAGRYVDPAAPGAADVGRVVTRAEELRRLVAPLADADAAAYGRYLEAVRLPREPDPEPRRRSMREALSAATDVPLAVAQIAAEVAELAAGLAGDGNANVRGDAAAGAQLAAAAATTAATLVGENLARTPEDPRLDRASALAAAARSAAATTATLPAPAPISPDPESGQVRGCGHDR